MDSFFHAVFGSPKVKGLLLNELMGSYGLKNNEVVFVGDSVTDWQAAKSTGIQFIWRRVPSDTTSIIDFNGPTLSNLHQLKDYLETVSS